MESTTALRVAVVRFIGLNSCTTPPLLNDRLCRKATGGEGNEDDNSLPGINFGRHVTAHRRQDSKGVVHRSGVCLG